MPIYLDYRVVGDNDVSILNVFPRRLCNSSLQTVWIVDYFIKSREIESKWCVNTLT
jgi:hypothetical protein